MHSALRPYVTTGLAIVGSSVLAFAPVAPPAPAESATTTSQSAQQVTLQAKVITVNPSPDAVDLNDALQGQYCGESSGNNCVDLEYMPVWTSPGQFGLGVEALAEELAAAAASGDDVTVFGFSEGAVVASQWLEAYLANPEQYEIPENLTFVVVGNPSRKYGGSGVPWGQVWPESDFQVIDVMNQYDPTGDQPANPFNVLAVLNATMGFFTNHLGDSYTNVDLEDPANVKWTEGNIEYVFVPAKSLPIVEPLRWIGLEQLADDLTGPLQYIIEQGYNRDPRLDDVGPISDAQSIFYAPINLLETVANIPYYAVQGTNRFSEAMRDSGSWWVYTETNVLGWDPANPEMTRAFVDFLIAIPSISTPMGEIADYWARANLPMNGGCTGTGRTQCLNPAGITDQMFKVMLWDLFSKDGYSFEGPITPEYNPVSNEETYWGQEMGQDGDPVKWHGETVYLELFAESKSFFNHLISPPEGIKTPTIGDQVGAAVNLFEALMVTWYPFVPKSQIWNPNETAFAYLFRPFAKVLCPDCNKIDPFMPTDWEVGTDIPKGLYIPPSVKDLYDEDGKYIGPPIESADEDADDTPSSFLAALFAQEEEPEEAAEETTEVTEDAAEEPTDVVSEAIRDLNYKFEPGEEDEVSDEAPTETLAEEPADEDVADEDVADEDVADADEDVATPTKPPMKQRTTSMPVPTTRLIRTRVTSLTAATPAAKSDSGSDKGGSDKGGSDKGGSDKGGSDKGGSSGGSED